MPGIITGYPQQLASASWLAISHIANGTAPPEQHEQLQQFAEAYKTTQNPGYLRNQDEIRAWFSDAKLLPPGVVALPDWGPEEGDSEEGADVRGVCLVRRRPRALNWCDRGACRCA